MLLCSALPSKHTRIIEKIFSKNVFSSAHRFGIYECTYTYTNSCIKQIQKLFHRSMFSAQLAVYGAAIIVQVPLLALPHPAHAYIRSHTNNLLYQNIQARRNILPFCNMLKRDITYMNTGYLYTLYMLSILYILLYNCTYKRYKYI